MTIIDEALSAIAANADDYDARNGAPPAPKIAIVTCADPRLSGIVRMLALADADLHDVRVLPAGRRDTTGAREIGRAHV